jgi:hypothetical protein
MAGWIKVFREFADWEWFAVPEMVQVFIYLLINANFEDKKWQGKVVEKGQLITSVDAIKCATHLSPQQIRTCLARLESTGEILKKSTNKYTLITICNYERYQSSEEYEQQTNNKQTTNKQQTNKEKEDKERKQEKENFPLIPPYKEKEINKEKEEKEGQRSQEIACVCAYTQEEFPDAPFQEIDIDFESAWIAYEEWGNKFVSSQEWNMLLMSEREKAMRHIPLYVESRPTKRFRKNFENYIRSKEFLTQIQNYGNEDRTSATNLEETARAIDLAFAMLNSGSQ